MEYKCTKICRYPKVGKGECETLQASKEKDNVNVIISGVRLPGGSDRLISVIALHAPRQMLCIA